MVEETIDRKTKNVQESGHVETNEPSLQGDVLPKDGGLAEAVDSVESFPPEENLADRLKALEEALEQAKAEAGKNRADYVRTLADMDNLRKRTERDKDNARKFAIERFALDLLDVVDNVMRAMDTLDAGVKVGQEHESSLHSVIQGVQMIHGEFEKIFAKNGIVRIKSLQEPFDPHFHQAVQQIEVKDVKPGMVVQEMRAGYLLNDRLLRPAMVVVSQ